MTSLVEYSTFILDKLNEGDVLIITAIITFLVIFISTILLFVRSSSSKANQILLLGICDSGKSLMYSQLILKSYHPTFTSMKENTGSYNLEGNKSFEVVDVPGHERLRVTCFDNLKSNARGIVFVVDSTTLQKELKDVAVFLYDIMTDNVIFRRKTPILVACNKQDQLKAKGCQIVKSQLEKEMTIVRHTKQAALQTTDDSYQSNIYLGKEGGDFKFSDLKWRIDFVDCTAGSTKSEKPEMENIENWLVKL